MKRMDLRAGTGKAKVGETRKRKLGHVKGNNGRVLEVVDVQVFTVQVVCTVS